MPIPLETEEQINALLMLPAETRYQILTEIAENGFVVTIKLSTDEEGNLTESILLQTKEEAANG
jgi:hypothetical protein